MRTGARAVRRCACGSSGDTTHTPVLLLLLGREVALSHVRDHHPPLVEEAAPRRSTLPTAGARAWAAGLLAVNCMVTEEITAPAGSAQVEWSLA